MSQFLFWGTDEFAVKILETLKTKEVVPIFIITTLDQPKGRGYKLTPPPVKIWAEKNKINFSQPEKLKDLEKLPGNTYDWALIASYGKIIPQRLIDEPKLGTLNIHPSLLPQYRGPAPLEAAILNGDKKTGVTIMKVDKEMDHGPILGKKEITLADSFTYEKLRDSLALSGAELLLQLLPEWLEGKLREEEQNHSIATYTHKFTKEDGELKTEEDDLTKYRKILALNPWPGTYFFHDHDGKKIRIKVRTAHLEDGKLVYDRVVPADHKEMNWKDFLNGLEGRKS